jgi:hypothetical protein
MLYNNTNSINKTPHVRAGNTSKGLTEQGRISSMSADIDSTSTPQTKQCTKCGTVYDRPAESFSKNARNKDGLENRCRECKSAYTRDRYANDPECRARQLASGRKWRENNPSKYLECNVNYRAKNLTKCREAWRLYRIKNRAACRKRTHR